MIKKILLVDDDTDILNITERFLSSPHYQIRTESSSQNALATVREFRPDIILMDIMMPERSGYEVCADIRRDPELASIPVIFVTALNNPKDKKLAEESGGTDFISKPAGKKDLLDKVAFHLDKAEQNNPGPGTLSPAAASDFIRYLVSALRLPEPKVTPKPDEIYAFTAANGLSSRRTATIMAEFLNIPYIPIFTRMPAEFPNTQCVIIEDNSGKKTAVTSNPFDEAALQPAKEKYGGKAPIAVTDPGNIMAFTGEHPACSVAFPKTETAKANPVACYMAGRILEEAFENAASDIHFEPKEESAAVSFLIKGDMELFCAIPSALFPTVLSILKDQSGIDSNERQRPQDGVCAITIGNRHLKLRMATSMTPYGESLVIKISEPETPPQTFQQIGLSQKHIDILTGIVTLDKGLLLAFGPARSGKTSILYSLLSTMDTRSRTLISVETAIEHKIAFSEQNEVPYGDNIAFDNAIKTAIQKNPDILFIEEIHNQFSASAAIQYAVNHLVIATMQTPNAITAISRMERYGIAKDVFLPNITGLTTQKLVRRLCPYCRQIKPLTGEESKLLAAFVPGAVLTESAHPAGCPICGHTGYSGKTLIVGLAAMNETTREHLKTSRSIKEFRAKLQGSGAAILTEQAIEKIKYKICAITDIFDSIFAQEYMEMSPDAPSTPAVISGKPLPPAATPDKKHSILLIDDDKISLQLMHRILETNGYAVTTSTDGVDAMFKISGNDFSLIISDLNMPNMDGFMLADMLREKNVKTPLIFFTSHTDEEYETKALSMGAVDYIKKPVSAAVLLLRIKNILSRQERT